MLRQRGFEFPGASMPESLAFGYKQVDTVQILKSKSPLTQNWEPALQNAPLTSIYAYFRKIVGSLFDHVLCVQACSMNRIQIECSSIALPCHCA